ncbi:MAG TPA: hypothetical protein VFY83_08925 [Anaerolineales bacterium]|nr:hypothetical protein [Anaerolineales bacterium]
MDDLARLEQSQKAKAMNLEEWRKSRIHEETLPSGLQVKLRDVTMTDLLFTGKLPESMLDIAQASAEQGKSDIDLKSLARNGQDFKLLTNELVLLCMVEPKIAEKADDEHLALDELNGEDKMFIFNWVNREVAQVRSFREGEDEPVAALQSGNGLRAKTK